MILLKRIICASMFLAVTFIVTAQTRESYGEAVEIMELDGNRATFSSVGIDQNANDVLVAAEKNLFQKMLYEGIEGFNDDKPMVERDSPVLDTFFHGKYQKEVMGIKIGKQNVKNSLAYRAYVISSQLENEPKKNEEGKFMGTAMIIVNTASLTTFLKMNKIILNGDSAVIKENVKRGRPNFLQRRRASKQE